MTNATICPTGQDVVAGYRMRLAAVREARASLPEKHADDEYSVEAIRLRAEESYLRLCILLEGPARNGAMTGERR